MPGAAGAEALLRWPPSACEPLIAGAAQPGRMSLADPFGRAVTLGGGGQRVDVFRLTEMGPA